MSYGDESNHEENLRMASDILPWVWERNQAKIRVGAPSVANHFGFSRYYAEFLSSHYLVPMSIDAYPGYVLQVTPAVGWVISNTRIPGGKMVSFAKRKASNTIRLRDALITSVVGDANEKRFAARTLAVCSVDSIDIEIEESNISEAI